MEVVRLALIVFTTLSKKPNRNTIITFATHVLIDNFYLHKSLLSFTVTSTSIQIVLRIGNYTISNRIVKSSDEFISIVWLSSFQIMYSTPWRQSNLTSLSGNPPNGRISDRQLSLLLSGTVFMISINFFEVNVLNHVKNWHFKKCVAEAIPVWKRKPGGQQITSVIL